MSDNGTLDKKYYNQLSQSILKIVSKYTFFPSPIIESQIKRLRKTAAEITMEDIPRLAENIGDAMANFTDVQKGTEVRRAIMKLRNN